MAAIGAALSIALLLKRHARKSSGRDLGRGFLRDAHYFNKNSYTHRSPTRDSASSHLTVRLIPSLLNGRGYSSIEGKAWSTHTSPALYVFCTVHTVLGLPNQVDPARSFVVLVLYAIILQPHILRILTSFRLLGNLPNPKFDNSISNKQTTQPVLRQHLGDLLMVAITSRAVLSAGCKMRWRCRP